ncbi:Nucleoside triphosphatase NudI [Candidatus Nanosynsacchari sp. TM7_G1_3_12Alb]|nr:Nucleoside triphosphatase NudI [Candidatus Nanosynsacchari sp. TM7_G1_3_12Alb]
MTKIVAKALVRSSEGLCLVLHRGNTHPRFPGHIDFPGGEVEPKETPEAAVMREIQEETGLSVNPNKLKKLFAKQYRQTTHMLFEAKLTEPDAKVALSWEHKSYRWITPEELKSLPKFSDADPYYTDVVDYLAN